MSGTGSNGRGAESQPPERVRVRIEIPRFGFVKREGTRIEYVSPVPCPFNYGCVPSMPAPDGDPLDVVVPGPRLDEGTTLDLQVHAVVRFVDDGKVDDKLVCGPMPTDEDLRRIGEFFRVYAVARRWMNRARGRFGETRFSTVERVER